MNLLKTKTNNLDGVFEEIKKVIKSVMINNSFLMKLINNHSDKLNNLEKRLTILEEIISNKEKDNV